MNLFELLMIAICLQSATSSSSTTMKPTHFKRVATLLKQLIIPFFPRSLNDFG
jgi:hypothetical protein